MKVWQDDGDGTPETAMNPADTVVAEYRANSHSKCNGAVKNRDIAEAVL